MFTVEMSAQADAQLAELERDPSQRRHYKAVRKALRLLADNPRHPSLNTHEWTGTKCPHGDKLWEAYAENQTSGAWRIYFCYPPDRRQGITIVAITEHP
jgi:hypothetical protein